MNREQKAAAIEEIATNLRESDAVFAIDYRGISVPQAAELRTRLRDADARFSVVKNTLTERAADAADADAIKPLLEGPTALAFVRGDAAAAAKALRDYGRETDLLPFKGGLMNGDALSVDDIMNIARLPSREVLYGQLVGVVAHPISGRARTLNALIGGVAIALGQIRAPRLVGGESPAPAGAGEPEADATAVPDDAGTPPADADTDDDPDAGPAGDPEPAQPDQAEGADDPAETTS